MWCPLFLAVVGDEIPTNKKRGFFCSLSALELTLVCSGRQREEAWEHSICVASGKSLNLPEPQFSPLYHVPGDLQSRHLVLNSQGVYRSALH